MQSTSFWRRPILWRPKAALLTCSSSPVKVRPAPETQSTSASRSPCFLQFENTNSVKGTLGTSTAPRGLANTCILLCLARLREYNKPLECPQATPQHSSVGIARLSAELGNVLRTTPLPFRGNGPSCGCGSGSAKATNAKPMEVLLGGPLHIRRLCVRWIHVSTSP